MNPLNQILSDEFEKRDRSKIEVHHDLMREKIIESRKNM